MSNLSIQTITTEVIKYSQYKAATELAAQNAINAALQSGATQEVSI